MDSVIFGLLKRLLKQLRLFGFLEHLPSTRNLVSSATDINIEIQMEMSFTSLVRLPVCTTLNFYYEYFVPQDKPSCLIYKFNRNLL